MKISSKSVWLLGVLLLANVAEAAVERRITVSGACTRRVVSDRGAISAVAEAQDADLREATRQATRIYERLRDDVKKLGLKDAELETSEFNVQEARDWVKDRWISRGYKARMGLSVTTSDIQRIGEVIAIAARHQVRDVGQLQVFLSTEKSRAERFACLEEAARDARKKADQLASSLGAKLGKVETLTEIDTGYEPGPVPMMAMARSKGMEAASDVPSPSVEAGSREIRVSVQAAFSLD